MGRASDIPPLDGFGRTRCFGGTGWIPRDKGHTLIELVVVLAILALSLLVPLVSIGAGLDRVGQRASAQTWQAAAASGQIGSLWGQRGATVLGAAERIRIESNAALLAEEAGAGTGAAPVPNVSRWRTESGAKVSFVAPFACPDSAGSLRFGEEGVGVRVVVRAESGLTRREVR